MNDLLFAALILVLLYYFFYYLPNQQQLSQSPPKLTTSQGTQTDPAPLETKETQTNPDSELENTLTNLIKDIQDFNKKLD